MVELYDILEYTDMLWSDDTRFSTKVSIRALLMYKHVRLYDPLVILGKSKRSIIGALIYINQFDDYGYIVENKKRTQFMISRVVNRTEVNIRKHYKSIVKSCKYNVNVNKGVYKND